MPSVISDLQRWGPDSPPLSISLSEAEKYTWKLATTHYENFPVVSWAVPKRLRQHFANVYAFCRWADDLGDETGSTEESMHLLTWWKSELEHCYKGKTSHPVFIALDSTIQQFQIPMKLFADLISAFVQDQSVTQYDTYEQLLDYCCRSADPVGRIVLYLANRVNDNCLTYSDAICTGLQLANFWQDVARDADIGRCYIPAEDREHFGYTEADYHTRSCNDAFIALMKFQVDRTRQMLLSGKPLVQHMPGRLKVDIDLIARGGLLVLNGIERVNYDVWTSRPVVKKHHLLWQGVQSLTLCGLLSLWPPRS